MEFHNLQVNIYYIFSSNLKFLVNDEFANYVM